MAKVIEFYVPDFFPRKVKWIFRTAGTSGRVSKIGQEVSLSDT
jgi:hypothetical protein